MRIGFFQGVDGDLARWQRIRAQLVGCDRLLCLGDFFGEAGAKDNEALWEAWRREEGTLILLAGRRERRLARCASLEPRRRNALEALQAGTVEMGVAFIGGELSRQRRGRAGEEGPCLVAPLTVAASEGGNRIWRSAGGLCRVEAVEGGGAWSLGGAKLRLDLAPASTGGAPCLGIFDAATGRLELRAEAAPARALAPAGGSAAPRPPQAARPMRRRRARVAVGQGRLAV